MRIDGAAAACATGRLPRTKKLPAGGAGTCGEKWCADQVSTLRIIASNSENVKFSWGDHGIVMGDGSRYTDQVMDGIRRKAARRQGLRNRFGFSITTYWGIASHDD